MSDKHTEAGGGGAGGGGGDGGMRGGMVTREQSGGSLGVPVEACLHSLEEEQGPGTVAAPCVRAVQSCADILTSREFLQREAALCSKLLLLRCL